MMAEKKTTTRRRRSKKKKGRKAQAALSLSAVIAIAFLLERMGLLNSTTWNALLAGNFGLLADTVSNSMRNNFTGSGVPTTMAGGITLALVLVVIRAAMKGRSIPLSGRPRRLTA